MKRFACRSASCHDAGHLAKGARIKAWGGRMASGRRYVLIPVEVVLIKFPSFCDTCGIHVASDDTICPASESTAIGQSTARRQI